jgi:predicted Zn-dependent peptidase
MSSFTSMTRSAQTINRSKPPQTPDLPVFRLPAVFETTFPNGLQVLLVEDRRFPLVSARLGFHAGSKYDPQDLAGLSESAGALLTEGTVTRSARQIAEEVAGIGGTLRAGSSPDALLIEASALSENLSQLLDLVSDVARNATFPEDEVALRKQNRTQELLAERSQAAFLADEKFAQAVFGSHPYSRQNPTLESIERLNRPALTQFRDRHLLPNHAVLVLLGALPLQAQALGLIRARFGGWNRKSPPPPPPPRFPRPRGSLVLVDRPGSVQADIRIGKLAVTRTDPDYFPLLVGGTILGGGASSRLFTNIREHKGFAYDAHSALQPLKDSGSFSVSTQVRNEVLEPALEALLAEMKDIARQNVSAEELLNAKNYLCGTFVIRLETQGALASQLAAVKLMGLPIEYLETYTSQVRAVEPGKIRAATSRYMTPKDAALVVVGDASKLGPQLQKFGRVTIEQAP